MKLVYMSVIILVCMNTVQLHTLHKFNSQMAPYIIMVFEDLYVLALRYSFHTLIFVEFRFVYDHRPQMTKSANYIQVILFCVLVYQIYHV